MACFFFDFCAFLCKYAQICHNRAIVAPLGAFSLIFVHFSSNFATCFIKKPKKMEKKGYFTLEEACHYMGMKKSYLYKMTAEHRIKFYVPTGKRLFFKRQDLDEWMEGCAVSTNEEVTARAQAAAVGM